MSGFIAANSVYNIQTDNEITVALSHFNEDLMFDVFIQQIQNRESFYGNQSANMPIAFEQQFKYLLQIYPMNKEEIEATRIETYRNIINIVCSNCGLQFNDTGDMDYYSLAVYLYQLLVSDFFQLMNQFFINYILKEKNELYAQFGLAEEKRNKDSSTMYNKKLYKNPKLAIIVSNLDSIISQFQYFNLSMHDILNVIYGGNPIVQCIEQSCSPITDFYCTNYLPTLNSSIRPVIITDLRMALQAYAVNDNINII